MGEVTEWVAGALGVPRAVLIPYGGTLAQLPWHAAWTADANVPEPVREYRRRYVCDRSLGAMAPAPACSAIPAVTPPAGRRRGRQ